MDDIKFNIEHIYGTVEPKTFKKFEDGKVVTYSFAIHRDRGGNIIKTTEPSPISVLSWEDGHPFTKADLVELDPSYDPNREEVDGI